MPRSRRRYRRCTTRRPLGQARSKSPKRASTSLTAKTSPMVNCARFPYHSSKAENAWQRCFVHTPPGLRRQRLYPLPGPCTSSMKRRRISDRLGQSGPCKCRSSIIPIAAGNSANDPRDEQRRWVDILRPRRSAVPGARGAPATAPARRAGYPAVRPARNGPGPAAAAWAPPSPGALPNHPPLRSHSHDRQPLPHHCRPRTPWLGHFSMGGMQTHTIAMAHLELFSHIGIFSGGVVTPRRNPPTPLSSTPG